MALNLKQLYNTVAQSNASLAALGIAALFFLLACYNLINTLFMPAAIEPNVLMQKKGIEKTKTAPEPPANLAAVHFFGAYDPSIAVGTGNAQNAPKTQLNLILNGIFFNKNGPSAAVISTAEQAAKLYYEGNPVPGNAVISQILPNMVVLKRNNELEVLLLPQLDLSNATNTPIPGIENLNHQ